MSSFVLRCFALATMLVDHVGAALLPRVLLLRVVGRLSFPVYCFLLAEGFAHTRSAPRYLLRLTLFAVLSEVPFDLVFFGRMWQPASQNVFFTLAISLLALMAYARLQPRDPWLAWLCVGGCCVLAILVGSDYTFFGVLLTLSFYLFRRSLRRQALGFAATLGIYLLFDALSGYSLRSILLQASCLLALVPIVLYNYKPGYRGARWLFYALYPAHLLALYGMRALRIVPRFWGG